MSGQPIDLPLGFPSDSLRAVSGRSDAFALVKKHGRNTTSFQALAEGMQHWIEGDACVAYTETGGSWVAAGGPITSEEREIEVMERFAEVARQAKRRVRFFALERDVTEQSSFTALHIGQQPIWDPSAWPGGVKKKVRDQIRRAWQKNDISVRVASASELFDLESPTRRGVDEIIRCWLDARRMAPMSFLVRIDPYHLAEERRFFIAEHEGRVVGVLVAIPIYARNGWFFDQMLRLPNAPQCTIELMFDYAMRMFAEERRPYVTFGLSPLAGTPSPTLRAIRDRSGALYNFSGLHAFKAKLAPYAWEPVYLAFPKGERGVSAVFDTLSAFTPRGIVRFGWDTLRQRLRQ